MKIKIKPIIVIIILFLSILIIGWNFNLKAKSLDNETSNTSNSRTTNRLGDENFEWGEIEVISEPIVGQDINVGDSRIPRIAVENDKIYVVWDDNTDYNGAGKDPDIFYRYFDGMKWSEIQIISEPVPGQNLNNGDSLIPNIAVENGKIYVVWQDNQEIFYRCNLTGNSWEDIKMISEPVGSSMSPKVVVENNKIYVVWNDNSNTSGCGTDWEIFYRCNLTGNSWEDIQVVSEPVLGQDFNIEFSSLPEIAVENGNVYFVWVDDNYNLTDINHGRDIFFRYYNGNSWSEIEVISERTKNQNFNIINVNSGPSIAVENDKIYTVWCSNNTPNENWEIFYRCNLTGTNWESIQVISDPIPNSNFNANFSIISGIAVENGKIFIVWSDANRTNGYVTDSGIFYRCNVTGANWEDIQIISEHVGGGENISDYGFSKIAVNRGKCHIVWADIGNINGAGTDPDIFYRYIFLPFILSHLNVVPISGNTSTTFNFTITYIHLLNMAPIELTVYIDNKKYSMFEINPADINYLDGKDYFFNIKNLDIRTHTHQFYASDGKYNFFTALANKPYVYNTPPNIITENNLIVFEDTYYEVNYEYEDIDVENVGQLGIWDFSTNATWLNFNPIIATLYGTPINNDVSKYWVNITINDTMDFDFTNFTLIVLNVNDPPKIITEDVTIAIVDELYKVDYEAIDIDPPPINLIWSLSTNATWLNINATTGVLEGTPAITDLGWYNVNVTVDDGNGGLDWHEFIITVIGEDEIINQPPKIITDDELTAIVNITYSVDYEATDDRTPIDRLQWFLETNASWLRINSSTGVLSGTPELKDIGSYWVKVSVSDGEDGWDFHNFNVTTKSSDNGIPEEETTKKDSTWIWIILVIIVIIIIIVLILLFIFLKKKKGEEEEPSAVEEQPTPPEEVPPEQQPVPKIKTQTTIKENNS